MVSEQISERVRSTCRNTRPEIFAPRMARREILRRAKGRKEPHETKRGEVPKTTVEFIDAHIGADFVKFTIGGHAGIEEAHR